jgi:integral membrane sensor domain MASE1
MEKRLNIALPTLTTLALPSVPSIKPDISLPSVPSLRPEVSLPSIPSLNPDLNALPSVLSKLSVNPSLIPSVTAELNRKVKSLQNANRISQPGVIIGVCAGLVAIIALVLLLWFIRHRKRKRRNQRNDVPLKSQIHHIPHGQQTYDKPVGEPKF